MKFKNNEFEQDLNFNYITIEAISFFFQMFPKLKVSVIGSGNFGTAIATLAARFETTQTSYLSASNSSCILGTITMSMFTTELLALLMESTQVIEIQVLDCLNIHFQEISVQANVQMM